MSLLNLLTAYASLCIFGFGYEQGSIGPILANEQFLKTLNFPSDAQLALLVSLLELGAVVTALWSGSLGDRFGRRPCLWLGGVLLCFGGLAQALSESLLEICLARFVTGLGIGLLSAVSPIYLAEVSPAESRGKLGAMEFTGNIAGYASAVWIDILGSRWSGSEDARAWRWPLSIQAVIGLGLVGGAMVIPESPRWLMARGRQAEAEEVFRRLGQPHKYSDGHSDGHRPGTGPYTDRKVQSDWKDVIQNPTDLKRILIGASSQMLAQFQGINIVSYYVTLVFKQAGFKKDKAMLLSGLNALVYLLSTFAPWVLVDTLGRRPIFLSGSIAMALCLLLTALAMRSNSQASLVVLGIVSYNAAFGASWGLSWAYAAEIMPVHLRSKGVAISTASNWFFNWIVGFLTPILQDTIGWALFLLPAIWCVIAWAAVYWYYPETKGVELEDMAQLFGDDVGSDLDEVPLLER